MHPGRNNATGTGHSKKDFFLSVGLAVLLVLLSLIEGDRAITNGLIVGSLAGLSFFAVAWWCVSVIVRNKKSEKPNPLMAILAIKIFILKFPLLGIALWYAFKYLPINPLALVGGIAVTQVAILISALAKFFK